MTATTTRSILIVDDSATTRAMIKRVLRMASLPVDDLCEAGDGKDALDLMESRRVDLVLADLNMPKMDGAEMIRRMFKDERLRNIPVYIISAQPNLSLVEELTRCGVRGYLPKPFTPESVREMLKPIFGLDPGGNDVHG